MLLENEINKSLKLMGLLTEAAIPAPKLILKALFGSLSELDGVMDKIAAKVGTSFRTRTLAGIESAIASNKITRKEVIGFILSELGKKPDEIVELMTSASPDLLNTLTTLAKQKKTRQEMISAVSGLSDLPDTVIDALLKKSGFVIGSKMTIRDFLNGLSTNYPELYKENWFKSLKNENTLAKLVADVEKQFTGKNLGAVESEIKNMMQETENLVVELAKKKKLENPNVILQASKKAGNTILKFINPFKVDPRGQAKFVATFFTMTTEAGVVILLYKLIKCYNKTEGVFGSAACLAKSEAESVADALKSEINDSPDGLKQYLNKLNPNVYTNEFLKNLPINPLGNGKYEVTKSDGGKVIFIYTDKNFIIQ